MPISWKLSDFGLLGGHSPGQSIMDYPVHCSHWLSTGQCPGILL